MQFNKTPLKMGIFGIWFLHLVLIQLLEKKKKTSMLLFRTQSLLILKLFSESIKKNLNPNYIHMV